MKFIYPVVIILAVLISSSLNAQNELRGTIKDAASGETVPGMHVFIPALQKGTASDSTGDFSIREIPEGTFRIQFSHISYQTQIKQIRFTGGETKRITLAVEPTIVESEEVIVSAGGLSTQHENAIKVEMLQASDISASPGQTVMEKLARIPGVDFISKGNAVTKPVIRGLSNSNILVLNNGVKMENFQFSENHPYLIDEYGTDRIEVIKGPASLLYGSDAVGGIVNFIREKPADEGSLAVDLNQKFHSNTRGIETNVGVKQSGENAFWGIRGGLKKHQDFISGAGNRVPNTRFNMFNMQAFAGMNRSFGTFKLYYDYNEMKLGMSVPEVEQEVKENAYANEVWYQDLSNHLVSLKNTLYFNDLKVDIDGHWQQNHRQLTTVDMQAVDMLLNNTGIKAGGRYAFSGNSELIAGVQANTKSNENGQAPNHVLPDHTVSDLAFFALWQLKLNNGLHTQAGMRWDYRLVDIPEQASSGMADDERIMALNQSYDNLSFSAGATYRLSGRFLLRSNLASAHRTPGIAELTQDGVHGSRYEKGNRNLQSQVNYEGDVSFHYHCCHVMLDASAFYNYVHQYIFLAPTGNTRADGLPVYEYNQKDAQLYGGEVQFQIRPVQWFSSRLSYGKTIGRRVDGSYLPFIPQGKIKAGAKIEALNMGVFKSPYFDLNATYAFKQGKPSEFESATPNYFLLGMRVGTDVQFGAYTATFSLTGSNILDEAYMDHLSTLKPLGYRQMGRNIVISVKLPLQF